MTIRTIISCLGIYFFISGLSFVLSMVTFAFTPGVYAESVTERFLMPGVIVQIVVGVWKLLAGLWILLARDGIARFLRCDGNLPNAADLSKLGPVLFQLLALYLIISSSGEFLYALWGVGQANGSLSFRIHLSNMILEGRLASLLVMALSAVLLFKARWLFGKLNPNEPICSPRPPDTNAGH